MGGMERGTSGSATTTHVAVSVALSDAGEATRALALAKALRDRCPDGHKVRISFLSGGGRFEPMIEEAGFQIVACQPRVAGSSIAEDLQWELPELVGSAELARSLIEGQRDALRELRPDVVLHGMWPFASLAARMLGVPTVCFLPLSLHPSTVTGGLVRDLPDPVPVLTRLPRPLRQQLARVAAPMMARAPIFHQQRLGAGARACGWPGEGPFSFFEALAADLTLVTDLPSFHNGYRLPENFAITGPIFAADDAAAYTGSAVLDPDIVTALRRDSLPAVLVTMGSSGTSEVLCEAIRAVVPPAARTIPGGNPTAGEWNVVVLASPAVCSLAEARAAAGDSPRVLVTDRFVPGPAVNRVADVVVSHGGQGTVQTALAAGTPLVGVGLQTEQQINLDHVMDAGAGIRIQLHNWRAATIRNAVRSVLADPGYRRSAKTLAETMRTMDGAATAADRMWDFLLAR
jgi:UDP:flavonoid glycosyltransferase YjiC (YdhE family)